MNGIFGIFIKNLFGFDAMIWLMACFNAWLFLRVREKTNRVYRHFNAQDRMVNLNQRARRAILKNTKEDRTKLTATELLTFREDMNKSYALYSNFTSMFPLMGMLGTVISLIPMVNSIGTESTGLFFSALTSTFWGIVAALLFKGLDSTVSYKIDDVEKHMEYLFNPVQTEASEQSEASKAAEPSEQSEVSVPAIERESEV